MASGRPIQQPDSQPAGSNRTDRRKQVVQFLLDNGLFIAFILEVVLFAVAAPNLFLKSRTLEAILRLSGPAGIVLASYTITLISGQIDLSTAQVGGMASLMFAAVFQLLEWPLGVALALTVFLTIAVGLLSSYLIRQGIPSFVSTLAVGVVCGGIGYLIINLTKQPGMIRLVRPPLRDIANFEIIGVPFVIPLMFVAYIIGWIVLNQTRFGAHIYALGGNPAAAALNGINAVRIARIVLVTNALISGMAGILIAGRQLAAQPGVEGLGQSLTAALFAGVALSGGSGKIERTLIGLLFLSTLTIGLGILNVSAPVRQLINGLAFVFAILLDSIRQQLAAR